MVCPHCGAENAATGGRCTTCHAPLTHGVDFVEGPTMTPSPQSVSDAPTIAATSGSRGTAHATEGPLRPGDAFGARYRILKILGAGGMGVVYHAWDSELGVALALKVIRPEVMADPEAARDVERRFKRELLLARQVTHRNVVRIHDLGEVDGIKYLTMPFVEGRNLGTILHEAGALPVPRALRMAKQIATGLQAAHDAGVVHRDLKPENIMIAEDDQALIMDFGISRSMSGTGAGTMMGAVVGTLEYMAPEQGRGQPADQRADIYAFGLMLYDMIAGRSRLQAAEGPVAEMMSRMTKAPPKLSTRVGKMPEPLESIVARCIEPDPARRYQSTAALVADLNALDAEGRRTETATRPRLHWAAVATLATILTAGAVSAAWWLTRHAGSGHAVTRDPVSVLIADFENAANDPVFTGSLEQALAIAMEGAPFVTSYSRTSAQALGSQIAKEKALNERVARLVALREGVRLVLAGVVARSGDRYQLTLRAVSPADGQNVASVEATARSKADVLGAIATLASEMREELGDTAADAGAETLTASTLEAVRDYSIAQDLQARGRNEEAIKHYEAAIKNDPQFGRAYSGMATSYFYLGRRDDAERMWKEALKYMDRMTEREKYRTRGTYFLAVTQNYEKAIEEYANLVRLYPADRVGRNNLAYAYFATLNFPKAREEGARAVELAPNNVVIRNNSAMYAMYAGEFDSAAKEAEQVITMDASFWKAYLVKAMAALARGDESAARDAYAQMSAKTDAVGASMANFGLADIQMYRGQWQEAEQTLRQGIEADRKTNNQASVAAKLIAQAESQMQRNDLAAARAFVAEALKTGRGESVLVPAAAVRARAGDESGARSLSAEMGSQLQTQARAYAKIIEGDVALAQARSRAAVDALRDATQMPGGDLWIARFRLGVAWVQAGQYAEALSEFDLCERRRGEATSVFLDDLPTFRYLAQLPYWKGRAQEGAGQRAAAGASYQQYLKLRDAASDPLARDAATRLAALK